MADETREAPPPDGPSDPMWATFRAAHPEVTLVLLPEAPPRDADKLAAEAAEARAAEENAPRVPLDEAREAMAALRRRLALVAEMMGCPDANPGANPSPDADSDATTGGWQRRGESRVRPQLQLRTAATESTPVDGELIAVRLGRLGWTAAHRPDRDVVWIDARAQDALMRVTVIEGWVTVRVTGAEILVDPVDAETLVRADRV